MEDPEEISITWSEYMRYRTTVRGFDLDKVEEILRFGLERYFDTETRRSVVVGRHQERLVIIPYEKDGNLVKPVTVHAITRQQIRFRQRTGRFQDE